MTSEEAKKLVFFPALWALRDKEAEENIIRTLRNSTDYNTQVYHYLGIHRPHVHTLSMTRSRFYPATANFPFSLLVPVQSTTHINGLHPNHHGIVITIIAPDINRQEQHSLYNKILDHQRQFVEDIISVVNAWNKPAFFFCITSDKGLSSPEDLLGETLLKMQSRFIFKMYESQMLNELKHDLISFFST